MIDTVDRCLINELQLGLPIVPRPLAGLAARLEGFHLMWMDEPVDEINDEALKKISHETVTPVGWGRRFSGNNRFQDLLRLQVVDVVRPDVGLCGIGQTRKAAALAEAYYTAIAPFHRGGPIGAAARIIRCRHVLRRTAAGG